MRYFVTKEFNEKIAALNAEQLAELSLLLKRIESSDKDSLLSKTSSNVQSLSKDIYVMKVKNSRMFFSVGEDNEGEYILLLDYSFISASYGRPDQAFAAKNPRTNMSLNPRSNMSINPRSNMSINPRSNMSINPRSNMSINPRSNMSINPRSNMSINYRSNMSINPRSNMSLNPRSNMSINPRSNVSFGGPFLYSLDLEQKGFLVRANEKVTLLFDMSSEFIGVAVRHDSGIVLLFDTDNNWTGFLVPTSQEELFLHFDTDNNWLGLVV